MDSQERNKTENRITDPAVHSKPEETLLPRYGLKGVSSVLCAILILAIMGVTLVGSSHPLSAFIGDIKRVSNNEGLSVSPQIAVSDNSKIFVVWGDDTESSGEIFFSVSEDVGLNFTPAQNISNDTSTSGSPQLAVSGDEVFVVWFGNVLGQNPEVYFAASYDGGQTFSAAINLSNNTGSSMNPQITILGTNVYVTWEDDDPSISSIPFATDIAYRKSDDSGQHFGTINNISHNDGFSSSPRIAVSSSGNVSIAWQDDSFPGGGQAIGFASSDVTGSIFSEPAPLSATTGFALISGIKTTDADNVYVSWSDFSGNSDVFLASSDDGGGSFTTFNVSHDNPSTSTTPMFSVAPDGKIWIVWGDDMEGSGDIFIANSTDNGSTFSDGLNLSNSEFFSSFPQIAISNDGDSIYAVWQNDLDLAGSKDIFFSGSTNGGQTFSSPANVAINPQLSESQVIAMQDHKLLIVWSDSSGGNPDILFRVLFLDQPSITIETISDENPTWGTNITATGIALNAAASDSVTVDWGDGSETPDIPVINNTWGPATYPYGDSGVGERTILAKLINNAGIEDATSSPHLITVNKRLTSSLISSIGSVIQGEDIIVEGELLDAVTGMGINGREMAFNGTGSAGLSSVSTASNGSFHAAGSSPDSVSTLWTVQAHFTGDSAYEPSDSQVSTYDTASPSSSLFPVAVGSPSFVNLTGFNATIEFDNVISDGSVYVSECEDEPSSDRYLSLGLCLILSSSARLASGSSGHVTMSFAGKNIPANHITDEVDIFHEELTGIVDVTESRNTSEQTVTGRVSTYSKFIVGIAVHESAPEGAARKQVYVGSDQTLLFYPTISRTIEFDSSEYDIGSSVKLGISDANANLNGLTLDAITAAVSSTSDSLGINITLVETDQSSGMFSGSFRLTSSDSSEASASIHVDPGDRIEAKYNTRAPFEVMLEVVAESGMLQLSPHVVTGVNFPRIAHAYELDLIDADLAPSSAITITISYADVAELDALDPSFFIIVQRNETDPNPTQWIDITSDIDLAQKSVTGHTTTLSKYSISYSPYFPSGPGGGSGALPRPGTGILLDVVAGVAAARNSGGGGSAVSSAISLMQSGQDVVTPIAVGSETVRFRFESIESNGQLRVDSEDIARLEGIFDGITQENQGLVRLDGTDFSTVGTIFDIDASNIDSKDKVEVTIPYLEFMVEQESNVRFLHYDEELGEWEDVTIDINEDENTVTGIMDSLSPVVAAVVDDGTFPQIYFESNPLSKVVISHRSSIEGSLSGQKISIPVNITNAQRENQEYAFIVQILDADDVARYVSWQSGILARGQSTEVYGRWTPEKQGSYTVEIFVLDNIDNIPSILSRSSVMKITVDH
jgi:hypothetical protein